MTWQWGGAAGSIFDSLNQKEQAPWKKRLAYHLEGLPATILVTAVTFVALFLDDARLAVLPPAADVACQVLSGIIMVRPPGTSFSGRSEHAFSNKATCGLAPLPRAADATCQVLPGVQVSTVKCFFSQVVFLTETVMASMVRRGYFLRMYFWIDSVATLSMALDISALMNAMTHSISQARPGLRTRLSRQPPGAEPPPHRHSAVASTASMRPCLSVRFY